MATTPIQRSDGWYIQVRKNGVSKSATFPLKSQAKAWAVETEANIMAGKFSGVADKKLYDVFKKYHDEKSPTKRSGRIEQIRLQYLMRDPIAEIHLKDLKDTHFIEWRDRMLNGTKSRKPIIGESVHRYVHIINPALKLAIHEWKWLKTNPLTGVSMPKRSQPRDRRPTLEEIKALCFVLGYEQDTPIRNIKQVVGAAMMFSIETACRQKDLCSILKTSVNFKDRTASVEWDTKTGKRDIALTTEACRIIKQVMLWHDGPTVFGVTSSQIESNFRKYKAHAMVEGLTFHDMKHEACTRLAKYMSIEDLARNVGTRNLSILMIYYNPTAAEIAKNLP
ncbi:MAG: tyrosine-type recombinase/integrase [Patescibacteria group bacterium]|nr:tyrosine-type recombinase/integrase [Patescibacteria group bacterium]